MASTTIMSRPKPTQLDTITVDATLSETYDLSNTVTDHPVEIGFNPTDHSRPNADGIVLECMISNTPIDTAQQIRAIQSGAFQPDVTSVGATPATQPQNTPGRMLEAYKALKALRDNGTVFKVITGLTVYETCAIEKLTVTRDAQTSEVLHFTVALKLIRIVFNKLTTIRTTKKPATQPKVKTGATTPTPDPPKQTALKKAVTAGKDAKANGAGFFGQIGAAGSSLMGN